MQLLVHLLVKLVRYDDEKKVNIILFLVNRIIFTLKKIYNLSVSLPTTAIGIKGLGILEKSF